MGYSPLVDKEWDWEPSQGIALILWMVKCTILFNKLCKDYELDIRVNESNRGKQCCRGGQVVLRSNDFKGGFFIRKHFEYSVQFRH